MSASATRPGPGYRILQTVLLRFFRAFYLFEVKGLEHLPASGPLIVAANHINVFDALMIAACVPRRTRFVAWNRTFTLPVIGWFMRACGCIPVDREKPDTAAFKESLRWLAGGNVLGIFPEGKYTTDGHLMPVKQGAARIALAAGATVVPATITGAYRSWPSSGPAKKMLPRPWKVSLKFHPPLHTASASADARAAARELTEKIAEAINRTLEPALHAEAKVDRLVEQPAPHIRIYEWFFCVVALAAWWRTHWDWRALAIAAAYVAYVIADVYVIRQSRLTRALRNFSPVAALVAAFPILRDAFGPMPEIEWRGGEIVRLICATVAASYMAWTMCAYHFLKYLQFQRFVRGYLVALYLTLLVLLFAPALQRMWLTALAVALSAYTLAYDFGHDRRRFRAACLPVIASCAALILLRGYPLFGVALNLAAVGLVFGYINVFKFRAHDGRRI